MRERRKRRTRRRRRKSICSSLKDFFSSRLSCRFPRARAHHRLRHPHHRQRRGVPFSCIWSATNLGEFGSAPPKRNRRRFRSSSPPPPPLPLEISKMHHSKQVGLLLSTTLFSCSGSYFLWGTRASSSPPYEREKRPKTLGAGGNLLSAQHPRRGSHVLRPLAR